MGSSDIIALVAVVLAPVSALVAVWLTAKLTAQQKAQELAAADRAAALSGLARFASLVLDANPKVVATGDLREYSDPAAAIDGLYQRWLVAREPLVLLNFTHPSEQVRKLAFLAQADLELALRSTPLAVEAGNDLSHAEKLYFKCQRELVDLGKLLTDSARP